MSPQDAVVDIALAGVPEEGKAVTKFTADDAREVGLPSPTALNYMVSVANLITNTALIGNDMGLNQNQILAYKTMGMAPEEIEKANRHAVKSNALAKMLLGHELVPPIPPLAAQQEIDIVKNRTFLRSTHLLLQMEAKGIKIKQLERTHERAAIELSNIPGRVDSEVYEFTIDDARRAQLGGDNPKYNQYLLRPRVMLWSRVVSEAYRATGGRAGVYTHEEKEDVADAPETERGDASHAAFAEQGRRNAEAAENPFGVTVDKPVQTGQAAPVAEATPEPGKPGSRGRGDRATAAPATASATESRPAPPADTPKAKTETPTAPPANAQATPQPVQQGFKAGDDDLPENMQPSTTATGPQLVKEEKPAGLTQGQRVERIATNLHASSGRDLKNIKEKVVNTWFKAFMGTGRLPAQGPAWDVPIAMLESLAESKPEDLLRDPHLLGVDAAAGWGKVLRHPWPSPEVVDLAKQVAIQRFPDDPDRLITYIDGTIIKEFGALGRDDFANFLRVYSITEEAFRLLDKHFLNGRTLSQVVSTLDFSKATETDVLTLIAGGSPATAAAAEDVPVEDEPGSDDGDANEDPPWLK